MFDEDTISQEASFNHESLVTKEEKKASMRLYPDKFQDHQSISAKMLRKAECEDEFESLIRFFNQFIKVNKDKFPKLLDFMRINKNVQIIFSITEPDSSSNF